MAAIKWPIGKNLHINVLYVDSKPLDLGNPRPKPREKLFDMPLIFAWLQKSVSKGLINLGNTCFMASVVQCLQHIPSFNGYLLRQHQWHCRSSLDKCIICVFKNLTEQCFHSQQPVKPSGIALRLGNIASHLRLGRQEDAHDFLHCLLNKMQDHLLLGLTPKPDQYTEMTTGVGQIFGGFLRSQIICFGCNKASNSYESLFSISLGISSVNTLKDALDNFIKPENMDGEEWYSCDICKSKRRASKTYSVHKPPRTLIIHLKRYEKRVVKISHNVNFGNMLDLGPYVSKVRPGTRKVKYELSSVLVHQGNTISSGHYYSFVCNPSTHGPIRTKEWYIMNDSLITRVPWEVVKSSQAYILFYVRSDCKPSNNVTNSGQKSSITQTVAEDVVNNIQMAKSMQLSDSQHLIKNALVKLVPYEYSEESDLEDGGVNCYTEQALSPAKSYVTQNVEDQAPLSRSHEMPATDEPISEASFFGSNEQQNDELEQKIHKKLISENSELDLWSQTVSFRIPRLDKNKAFQDKIQILPSKSDLKIDEVDCYTEQARSPIKCSSSPPTPPSIPPPSIPPPPPPPSPPPPVTQNVEDQAPLSRSHEMPATDEPISEASSFGSNEQQNDQLKQKIHKKRISENSELDLWSQTNNLLFKIPRLDNNKAFQDEIQRSPSKVMSNLHNVEELNTTCQDDNRQDTCHSKAFYSSPARKSRSPLRKINDKENDYGSRKRKYPSSSRSRSRSRKRNKCNSGRRSRSRIRNKSNSRRRSRSRIRNKSSSRRRSRLRRSRSRSKIRREK